MSQTLSPGAVAPASARPAWMIGGAIAALVLTVGAAFALNGGATKAPSATPVADSLASGEKLVDAKATAPATAAEAATPPASAKPVATARKEPGAGTAVKPVAKARPAAPPAVAQAPLCADCGTIESVREVVKKGEGSGVGAVAGGVLGAVVGNQVGKGNGRKVATVLGAVGGGMAGHEIEKRSKSTTAYEVRVKMDDGSVRTVEQAQSPRVGERVQVQGGALKPLTAQS